METVACANLVSSLIKNKAEQDITIYFNPRLRSAYEVQQVCKADYKEFAKDAFCSDGNYRGVTQEEIEILLGDALQEFLEYTQELTLNNVTFKNISSLKAG